MPNNADRRRRESDKLLAESIQKTVGAPPGTYLGDYKAVDGLLRQFAHDCLTEDWEAEKFTPAVEKRARRLAKVFLGQNPSYTVVPRWNEPGMIDAHLGKWAGVDSSDPEERVAGALISMAGQLVLLGSSTANENPLAEQWQWQADDVLDRFTRLFLNLPLYDLPPSATKKATVK